MAGGKAKPAGVDKAKERRLQENAWSSGLDNGQDPDKAEASGGNMGAGQSGKESLGSEKPSDGAGLGSKKPAAKK
jgi:hypothetical protein